MDIAAASIAFGLAKVIMVPVFKSIWLTVLTVIVRKKRDFHSLKVVKLRYTTSISVQNAMLRKATLTKASVFSPRPL
jgi:hypothetical protein